MQILHPFILLSLLTITSAQRTRTRSRISSSSQAASSSAAASDTPSSQLSTLPGNVVPTLSIPAGIPGNTLAARVPPKAESPSIPMLARAKDKAPPTTILSRVPADPNLPRNLDTDFVAVVREVEALASASSSTSNGTEVVTKAMKGTKAAETKNPKFTSTVASTVDQTNNAVLKVTAAGEIPSDLPTIAFPSGSSLPLIPTPKAGKSVSKSAAGVPTTLAKKVKYRGIVAY